MSGDAETDPSTTWAYDKVGNLITLTVIDGTGNNPTTKYEYDALNRIRITYLPDPITGQAATRTSGLTIKVDHDDQSNVKWVIDQAERKTKYELDALGRVVGIVSAHATNAALDGTVSAPRTDIYFDVAGNETRRLSPQRSSTDTVRSETVTTYDARNRKRTMVLPNPDTGVAMSSSGPVNGSSQTIWTYDAVGNVKHVTDALNRTTTNLYDALNRVTDTLLPNPSLNAVLALDTSIGVSTDRVNDTARPKTSYVYDVVGNLIEKIDAQSTHFKVDFDVWNRQVRSYLPDAVTGLVGGIYSTTVYDKLGNVKSIFTPHHIDTATGLVSYAVTTSEYDKRSRLIAVVLPNATTGAATGLRTEYRYDGAGNRQAVRVGESGSATTDDPAARVSTTEYDKLNRVIATVMPDATTGAATGLRTEFRYDATGNQIQIRVGETVAVGDSLAARVTTKVYDRLDRATDVYSPNPNPVGNDTSLADRPHSQVAYDNLGQVVLETVFLGGINGAVDRVTKTEYDRLGRKKAVYLPDAATGLPVSTPSASYQYDLMGNAIAVTTAHHVETVNNVSVIKTATAKTAYDRLNRKILATLPSVDTGLASDPILNSVFPQTEWQYDIVGNLKKVIEPHTINGQVKYAQTSFDYDRWNRQIAVVQPNADTGLADGLRTETGYDLAGNRIEVRVGLNATDPNKRITATKFDYLNRPTSVTLPDPDEIPLGADAPPQTNYYYDAFGNQTLVERIADGANAVRQTGYVYDALNRVTTTVVPDATVSPSNSSYGRVLVTGNTAFVGWSTVTTYDLYGNVQFVTDARGAKTEFEYDRLNRKLAEKRPDPVNTNVVSGVKTEWQYDLVGNVIKQTTPFEAITLTNKATFKFNARNQLIEQVQPSKTTGNAGGLRSAYTYDLAGNRLTESVASTDPSPRVTDYTYDYRNQVTHVRLPNPDASNTTLRPHTENTYGESGNLLTQTEWVTLDTTLVPRTTVFEYDLLNRRTKERQPHGTSGSSTTGASTEYKFDAFGNVEKSIQRGETGSTLVRETNSVYDRLNRKLSTTAPSADGVTAGAKVSWKYDVLGNVVQETGAFGQKTKTAYDVLNRVSQVFLPDATTGEPEAKASTRYLYDKVGHVVREYHKNADGTTENQTAYVYDLVGRLVDQIAPPLKNTDGSAVTTNGFALSSSADLNSPTLNPSHLLGLRTHYTYDDAGNVRTTTDAVGKVTTKTYDRLNHVLTVTLPDPDGAGSEAAPVTTFNYDLFGNVDWEKNGRNEITDYEYDRLNRKVKMTDPRQEITSYSYDLAGNLRSVTDAEGNTTNYRYDYLNRQTTDTITINSVNLVRTNAYDVDGRLDSVTDRNGRVREFDYDNLDRSILETWKSGGTQVYKITTTYDLEGHVKSQTSGLVTPDSVRTYTYDKRGRLKTDSNTGTPDAVLVDFTYNYDAAGRVQSRARTTNGASGPTDSYVYYVGGLLQQQDQSGTSGSSGLKAKRVIYTYDALGQYDTVTESVQSTSGGAYQTVVTSKSVYDFTGRRTSLTHQTGSPATTLASYLYDYDIANRLESQTISGVVETFSYDPAGELTITDRTGTTSDENYTYDGTGNRTNAGYSTDSFNRIKTSPIPDGTGTFTYAYDGEGNRISRTSSVPGADSTEYRWDHRNRLAAVVTKNSLGSVIQTVAYAYDANDLRIRKTVTTGAGAQAALQSVECWVNDGQNVVTSDKTYPLAPGAVGPVNYEPSHHYMHGPDVDQVFVDDSGSGNLLWALTDNNQSVRDVAVFNGATASVPSGNHRTFDSFGRPTTPITDGFLFGFTGREFDKDTGLQYNRARWLDPQVGRFISEDPIGFSGGDANLSRYAFNDPNSFTDPSGHSWFSKFFRKVNREIGRVVDDVLGDSAAKVWGKYVDFTDDVSREFNDFTHDVGDFFEEQWENGNIQKALLAVTAIATAGAAAPLLLGGAAGLAGGGGLAGAWTGFVSAGTAGGVVSTAGAFSAVSTTVTALSAGVNAYEAFSGQQVGGRDFSRILGGVALVGGGINGGLARVGNKVSGGFQWTPTNVLHASAGFAGGYEALSGRTIGDGTLTTILSGASDLTGSYQTFNGEGWRNKLSGGLGAANAGLGIAAGLSGNRRLALAARVGSTASGFWSNGAQIHDVYNSWRLRDVGIEPTQYDSNYIGRAQNVDESVTAFDGDEPSHVTRTVILTGGTNSEKRTASNAEHSTTQRIRRTEEGWPITSEGGIDIPFTDWRFSWYFFRHDIPSSVDSEGLGFDFFRVEPPSSIDEQSSIRRLEIEAERPVEPLWLDDPTLFGFRKGDLVGDDEPWIFPLSRNSSSLFGSGRERGNSVPFLLEQDSWRSNFIEKEPVILRIPAEAIVVGDEAAKIGAHVGAAAGAAAVVVEAVPVVTTSGIIALTAKGLVLYGTYEGGKMLWRSGPVLFDDSASPGERQHAIREFMDGSVGVAGSTSLSRLGKSLPGDFHKAGQELRTLFPGVTGSGSTPLMGIPLGGIPKPRPRVVIESEYTPPFKDPIDASARSAKPSLNQPIRHSYKNLGHHDPDLSAAEREVTYNQAKSVIPPNHEKLFEQSFVVEDPSGGLTRWTIEQTPKGPIVHKFNPDGNATEFHWSGSTAGKTASGVARPLSSDQFPPAVKKRLKETKK